MISMLLGIERDYQGCMGSLNREWDTETFRVNIIERLKNLKDADTFFTILKKIELCFNDPWLVSFKQFEEATEDEKAKKPSEENTEAGVQQTKELEW